MIEWTAVMRSGRVLDNSTTTLKEILRLGGDIISIFSWYLKGKYAIGLYIPPSSTLHIFKRNYIAFAGDKYTVLVAGWTRGYESLYAYLQPDGLVEIAANSELRTTFEKCLGLSHHDYDINQETEHGSHS